MSKTLVHMVVLCVQAACLHCAEAVRSYTGMAVAHEARAPLSSPCSHSCRPGAGAKSFLVDLVKGSQGECNDSHRLVYVPRAVDEIGKSQQGLLSDSSRTPKFGGRPGKRHPSMRNLAVVDLWPLHEDCLDLLKSRYHQTHT
jgi:hypothetical protein